MSWGKSNLIRIVFCGAAFCSILLAQEVRANLGGKVTDSQGSLVPNAEVVVISDNTGVKQQVRTNDQGNWLVQF
jgi:hypothetical protein